MEQIFLNDVKISAKNAAQELLQNSGLESGAILVVGCSSSEVKGHVIGTASGEDVARAVFDGIYEITQTCGLYLAAQCCEHLNRVLIIEKELALRERLPIVNVVPQLKAGGAFSTIAYRSFEEPVAVEHIQAQAGMDIGDTLIGMHLQDVAVPVRVGTDMIGRAHLVCARTRPKFVGGERAIYNQDMV